MRGPVALSMNGALGKILHSWGSSLTWTSQRQHAAHIVNGMESFMTGASFLQSLGNASPVSDCLLLLPLCPLLLLGPL